MNCFMGQFCAALKKYFYNFKGDLYGGITAGVVALPLALAFGVVSGAGAAAGIYGAIFVGLLASVFGGTKPQISGPTGPMTVVLASIIITNPGNFKILFASIILTGIFQIIFGLARVGQIIKFVPYPVISGFMSGIGIIIIILQIAPLLGLEAKGSPVATISSLAGNVESFNIKSIIVGVMTLFIMFFTPRKLSTIVPSTLLALISITLFTVIFNFDIKTIGEIPTGLPYLSVPAISFDEFIYILPFAFTLSILGSVDSLLTSLVADSITKTYHNSNKELIGQGIGNIFSGLFGGIAGAGATMRTVVNIKAGGKTPLAGVIHSIFLIIILLGAAPLAANVPMAVLAGILIKVGVDIIDYKFLKIIKHVSKYDLLVMITVFTLTVFGDLIIAVGAGILLSCLLFTYYMIGNCKVDQTEIKIFPQMNVEELVPNLSKCSIKLLSIQGVMFFGSCSRVLAESEKMPETDFLILNCESIQDMDISAMFTFENIISRIQDKKINLLLVLSGAEIYNKLLKFEIIKKIDKDYIFCDKALAIEKAKNLVMQKIGEGIPPTPDLFIKIS